MAEEKKDLKKVLGLGDLMGIGIGQIIGSGIMALTGICIALTGAGTYTFLSLFSGGFSWSIMYRHPP